MFPRKHPLIFSLILFVGLVVGCTVVGAVIGIIVVNQPCETMVVVDPCKGLTRLAGQIAFFSFWGSMILGAMVSIVTFIILQTKRSSASDRLTEPPSALVDDQ